MRMSPTPIQPPQRMEERAMALAGLLQACQLVHGIATVGSAEQCALECCIDSIFRIDADSTRDVYGGLAGLSLGINALHDRLVGTHREPPPSRIAVTVMHVERKLNRNRAMQKALQEGITDCAHRRQQLGGLHPAVFNALGELYARTISTLRPRVMVQGNPQYLGQASVVAEVRSLLLAAVRSAVLWRQLGGGYVDLLLRRRALLEAVAVLRGELPAT